MKNLLDKGVEIPLMTMDRDTEIVDDKAIMGLGNHKGATSQPDFLNKLVTKYIQHAFALLISLDAVLKIKTDAWHHSILRRNELSMNLGRK